MTDTIENHGRPEFAVVPAELLRDPTISVQAKALYALMATYTGERPGQNTLAEQAGVSDRTIRNWMNELEEAGWMSVGAGHSPDGKE